MMTDLSEVLRDAIAQLREREQPAREAEQRFAMENGVNEEEARAWLRWEESKR